MRELIILFIHAVATLMRVVRPGGVRAVIAESVLAKHQLLILSRSRRRAPNLRILDRIIAGFCSLWIEPAKASPCGDRVQAVDVLGFSSRDGALQVSVAVLTQTEGETWPERSYQGVDPRCRRNEEEESDFGMPSNRRPDQPDFRNFH